MFYDFRNNVIKMTKLSSIWFQLWKNFNKIIESPIENCTVEEFHIINTIARLAHHLDITLINENYQLFPDINMSKLLNKIMVFVLNHVDFSAMELLLSTCGSLVCIKEFSTLSPNDAQTLIAVLSLPWMEISDGAFKMLPLYKYLNVIVTKYSTLFGE